MTTGDSSRSTRANVVWSVASGALATLFCGLAGWAIDADLDAAFLGIYGVLMTVFFFAAALWRRRRSAR
ncbi:hypothetical protein [Nocardioides zeicaulis]|uniref:Uncharacterized protein n=1 Tax=Nocardioides zeicaulis TaxID=1776857 RepID=A0ABV6DWB2_9ACTN